MPDNRTVYGTDGESGGGGSPAHMVAGRVAAVLTEGAGPSSFLARAHADGLNVGFFKFVADKAYDLSSGSLYAAKMRQLSAVGGGNFTVEWVKLGSASASELLVLADTLVFSDIFDTAKPTNGTWCATSFAHVHGAKAACHRCWPRGC